MTHTPPTRPTGTTSDHRGVIIAIINNITHGLLDDVATDLTAITVEIIHPKTVST